MLPFARMLEYGNEIPPSTILEGNSEVLTPSPVPQARRNAGACSAEGKIYVFGGYTGGILRTFQVYNPDDNTFTNLSADPAARYSTTLTYHNGFIYMYSGNRDVSGNNNNDFWRYEISTDTWTQLGTTGYGNGGSDAYISTVGNYLYVIAGDGTNQLVRYDITSDTWSTLTSCPTGIGTNGGGCADDSNLYALDVTGILYKYSIANDSWEVKSSLGTMSSRICYIDGYVYAYGSNRLMAYNVASDTWTQISVSPSYNALQNCLVSMYDSTGKPQVYSLFGGGITSSVYRFT